MATSFSHRVFSPERRALSQLRTPLTAGELEVIEFFDRNLPEGWEIYVQPHMNGLRPDVVLLHPARGVAVYEIKDWNLDSLTYEYRDFNDGPPQLWGQDRSGKWFRHRDDPLAKVIRYKEEIRALYCPRLGALLEKEPRAASAVTAGVILTRASTEAARQLFEPAIRAYHWTGTKARYNT
ncbi:MAG: NERD domain-containing protein, partial [Gammaproteobacteria bacterium]